MSSPAPIPVIIDTREQAPAWFPSGQFVCERRKLDTGDYSIAGLEDRVCIERKELGDLVNTLIHDAIRFRKQLVRMSGFEVSVIVVEADVSDLLGHRYESAAPPTSVMGKVSSIYLDHGIPTLFWGARRFFEPTLHQFVRLTAERYWGPPVPVVEVGLGVAAGDPKAVAKVMT